jgi:hypothetical protein
MKYFQNLKKSWSKAFILLIHGLFPFIWKEKAGIILNPNYISSTRKHILNHYNIKSE